MKTIFSTGVIAVLAALAGCATIGSGVDSDVVFPDIEKSAWQKEGTFPNLDNLRAIEPGLGKDQLRALVGSPHFQEGLFGVREWDYVFHFRSGAGNAFVTCQYKVLFDRDAHARSFYWSPQACAEGRGPSGIGSR